MFMNQHFQTAMPMGSYVMIAPMPIFTNGFPQQMTESVQSVQSSSCAQSVTSQDTNNTVEKNSTLRNRARRQRQRQRRREARQAEQVAEVAQLSQLPEAAFPCITRSNTFPGMSSPKTKYPAKFGFVHFETIDEEGNTPSSNASSRSRRNTMWI